MKRKIILAVCLAFLLGGLSACPAHDGDRQTGQGQAAPSGSAALPDGTPAADTQRESGKTSSDGITVNENGEILLPEVP
ncbi:MAG: hypothetical protein J6Z23_07630 [Lachnospiraceae bacterium]|nr:hypothetical protein [Lachnospiraceae bacterium]